MSATALATVAAEISRQSGVNVVIDELYASSPVTFAGEAPLGELLELLSRQVGATRLSVGRSVMIGEPRDSDRVVFVGRVPRLSREELVALLVRVGGTAVEGSVADDGLVVLIDTLDKVRSLEAAVAGIALAGSATWAVQLVILKISDEDVRSLGIDAVPAVELGVSAASAAGSLSQAASGAMALASLTAKLRASGSRSRSSVVAEPFFLITDGSVGRYRVGGNEPYRVDVVTPGAVGVVRGEVRTVPTGRTIEVSAREVSRDVVRLRIVLEDSRVTGVRDDIPITAVDSSEMLVDVSSGGAYLVHHSVETAERSSWGQLLAWGADVGSSRVYSQVWVRAFRVAVGRAEGAGEERTASTARSAAVSDERSVMPQAPEPLVSPSQVDEKPRGSLGGNPRLKAAARLRRSPEPEVMGSSVMMP